MAEIQDLSDVFASPAQRRAARQLQGLFVARLTEPDLPLPGERALAKQFGVSRPTLRIVLREMERRGLLQKPRNRGRTIRTTTVPPADQGLVEFGQLIVMITGAPGFRAYSEKQTTGFNESIYAGALSEIQERGLDTLAIREERLNDARLQQLIDKRPSGVLMLRSAACSETGRRALVALKKARLPVVVQSEDRAVLADFDTVSSDHEWGAYHLTKWLIAHGRRRILRYWQLASTEAGYPAWLTARDAGYERALREAGLEVVPPLVPTVPLAPPATAAQFEARGRMGAGMLAAPLLLAASPVDALMVPSDGSIPEVAAACRFLGKIPNQNVALAGYDNYWRAMPERRWENTPPLVSMDKLNPQVGRALVQLLLDRISGRLPQEPQHRLLTPLLVESSGARLVSLDTNSGIRDDAESFTTAPLAQPMIGATHHE